METAEFLCRLSEASGISGYESAAAEIIRQTMGELADDSWSDALGNQVFVRKGDGGPRIMLMAHMDEIGLMVTKIEEGGFLRFTTVGGFDRRVLPAQPVMVHGKENLPGVIGTRPPHLQDPEEARKSTKMEDLYIDIGLGEEACREKVSVGDLVSLVRRPIHLQKEGLAGKGFDDRAGVAVIYECLKELAGMRHKADVYAVASVQEEVGLRGAATASFSLEPDIGVAIDVGIGDMPGLPDHETIKLGAGPAIARGPNIHPRLFDELVRVARDRAIPYQVEVSPGQTGTDAWAIQVTREGIPTALVSIPLRYMHTPVERLDVKDIISSGRLLAAFISRVGPDFLEELRCC